MKTFKEFLQESKTPIRAYHGTSKKFTEFNVNSGKANHPNGVGSWFSASEKDAESFAGKEGIVHHVDLHMDNPHTYPSYGHLEADVKKAKGARKLRANLQAKGHDGVIIDRSNGSFKDEAPDYIAFHPHQIKIVK